MATLFTCSLCFAQIAVGDEPTNQPADERTKIMNDFFVRRLRVCSTSIYL